MSRFDFNDSWRDEPEYVTVGRDNLWRANVRRALNGKPGRKKLQEVLEALEAMPTQRLIEGFLCSGGDVCLIGAYAVYLPVRSGHMTWRESLEEFAWYREGGTYTDTIDAGLAAGLNEPLAWALASMNDCDFAYLSPEDRWIAIVQWLRQFLSQSTGSGDTVGRTQGT